MKKKILIPILILATSILLGYLYSFYFIRVPKAIATDMWAFKFPDKYDEYQTIKCDFFDLTAPEYAFVDKMPERDLEIIFYNTESGPFFGKIVLGYTGGTDVKNTTFPELVKMVKEDCSQFQKAKGDPSDTTINWSYSPAPTQEEINNDAIDKVKRDYSRLMPEAQSLFDEIYGDPSLASDEVVLKISDRIEKEGGMNESIIIKDHVTSFNESYKKATPAMQKRILDTYGDWKGMSDKEMSDWFEVILEDLKSGKLKRE